MPPHRAGQGLLTRCECALPEVIVSSGKAAGAPFSIAKQATGNAAGGIMNPAGRIPIV